MLVVGNQLHPIFDNPIQGIDDNPTVDQDFTPVRRRSCSPSKVSASQPSNQTLNKLIHFNSFDALVSTSDDLEGSSSMMEGGGPPHCSQ